MAKFNSHIKSLRIVLKPAMPVYEGGIKVGDNTGRYAQFVDGQFETKDEKDIEKLESLSTFNVDFFKTSEEDAEKTQAPTVDGDLQKLTKKELQALAAEKEIVLDGTETKDRLLELLKEPSQQQ
ncbi:MAG: hypothetical protein ACYC6X_01255 [Minisyncoccota bacterium]